MSGEITTLDDIKGLPEFESRLQNYYKIFRHSLPIHAPAVKMMGDRLRWTSPIQRMFLSVSR